MSAEVIAATSRASHHLWQAVAVLAVGMQFVGFSGHDLGQGNVLLASVAAIGLGMIGVTIALVVHFIEVTRQSDAETLLGQVRDEAVLASAESNALLRQFDGDGAPPGPRTD